VPFALCPFCGIASDAPHDTQEACLDALRAEISRTQSLLTRSTPVSGTPFPVPRTGADLKGEPDSGTR
jgi:hypothetical protein